MKRPSDGRPDETLPPSEARRSDKACDEFEAAWRAGQRPQIEEYLRDTVEPGRSALLRNLLALQLDLRSESGERPTPEEYRSRFPEHVELISTVFEEFCQIAIGQEAENRADDRTANLPTVPGYEILGVIGTGGMGTVYKARHVKLNRLVALKTIFSRDPSGQDRLARFRIEAESIARQQHPNIVQIHETFEHEGCPYFSLEFVDGGNLDEKLAGKPQPARQAAELVETLARAIHHAHQHGIIHRDLKPANVLLTADGVPKITDFGLAKHLERDAGQTKSGDVIGTPSYIPPEQAAGKTKQVGPEADVYGLGAILYEMLTGRPPFRAATALLTLEQARSQEPVPLRRLRSKLHRDIETICLKCLQKEPRKRYASAEALADDLRRFLEGEPIQARPVGTLERSARWVKRRPAVSLLTGLLLLLASLGVGGAVWLSRQLALDRLYEIGIPEGWPPILFHSDNRMTVGKVDLGRRLFIDPRMSVDNTVSCATCHDPANGWSNGKRFGVGVGGKVGRRHVPSLVNVAYRDLLGWGGEFQGFDSLEKQALRPILDPTEMGMPSEKALESKLNAIKGYRDQFQEVFGTDVTAENVAKALAAFQRTILSGNAPYDRYKAGHEEALSEEAVRGMKLFFGKANCFACHSGRSFTDNNVHNLGIGYDPLTDSFDDVGHEKVTGAPEDRGTFKTPTLREIRRTSPYITHNGQFEFKSLKHAVEFYDQGGIPNDDLDEEIFPLNLTAEEKADLVRFLEEGLSSAAGPDIQALKSPSSTTNQATALWWILGIVAVLLAVVYGFVRRARGVATILLATICASVGCDSGERVAEEKVTAPSLAEGLDNPCGVAVQPETGHVFVSTKERIIRVVPGNPPTVSDEITDFPTARYRPVPFQFGPLGLAFLGKDILVVGDGSLPDGEDLVRFYKVGSKARPRGKALTVADMMYSSGPIPRGEDSNSGEGNFYGIAVTRSTIFVTCNGDDTKGWISKIELGGGKPGPLTPFIKSKVETERDAPTGAVITPDGELLVTQLGELTRSRNSLLTFYDPSTGTLKRKLETGLRDLIAVAYSPKTGKLYGLDFSYRLLDDGKLCRLVIDGDEVRTEKILSLYGPTAMAFAPDGTLYVAIIDEAKEGDEKKPGKLLGIKGL